MALQNKLPAEQLVSLCIRGISKLRENLEVWFSHPEGALRRFAVLKHEEIPQEGLVALIESALSESCPKIKCTSHCFLGSVVEVVSERRANLRFRFKRDDEKVIFDNKQVPFLSWAKVTRKLKSLFPKDELGLPIELCVC